MKELLSELNSDFDSETIKQIRSEMIDQFGEDGTLDWAKISSGIIKTNRPLTFKQSYLLSKTLTENYNRYILVLPYSAKANCSEPVQNEYCRFTFKIVAEHSEFPSFFDLFRTYRKSEYEDGYRLGNDLAEKTIVFPNEVPPSKWTKDIMDSLEFRRYAYAAVCGDYQFVLLTEERQEIGEEYVASGLLFSMPQDAFKKSSLSKIESILLSTHIQKKVYSIGQATLDKMKGKSMEWFADSVMYPFHHSVTGYSLLMTLNFFHLSTHFPFNIMVIGPPQTGKTAILSKLSAITGEEMVSMSTHSTKGFIPSFHSNFYDAGILGKSRHKALCNEFFEFLSNLDVLSRKATMSKMKDILEGARVKFISGTGSMTIQQKCDMVGVSNPITKISSLRTYRDPLEMYGDFEPAALDRMLFFTLGDDQQDIVTKHVSWADKVLLESDRDFNSIDYGDLLNITELRNILFYLKRVKYAVSDWNHIEKEDIRVRESVPNGVFSRRLKFMVNIATAYAVIRSFSDGLVAINTDSIIVLDEDITKAADYLIWVLQRYVSMHIRERNKLIGGLTPAETKVFELLRNKYETSPEKFSKRIQLTELFGDPELGGSLDKIFSSLEEKKLIISDGFEWAMHYPELAPDELEVFEMIERGEYLKDEHNLMLARILSKKGLVTKENEMWVSLWNKGKPQEQAPTLKGY